MSSTALLNAGSDWLNLIEKPSPFPAIYCPGCAVDVQNCLPHYNCLLQVLSALHELLGTCPTDDIDTLFRALVATATLVAGDTATREVAQALGVGVSPVFVFYFYFG
jgi:hypothetical protein